MSFHVDNQRMKMRIREQNAEATAAIRHRALNPTRSQLRPPAKPHRVIKSTKPPETRGRPRNKGGCDEPGCQEPYRADGKCNKHYFKRYNATRIKKPIK